MTKVKLHVAAKLALKTYIGQNISKIYQVSQTRLTRLNNVPILSTEGRVAEAIILGLLLRLSSTTLPHKRHAKIYL